MRYVYLLRSKSRLTQTYVGQTSNLEQRLVDHDAGRSPHTSKFAPWELVVFVGFPRPAGADRFEAYLKTGSGRAFAKKHFL